MMVATASAIYCSQGVNNQNATEITTADIKIAVKALRLGNARLMTKPIMGENRFATSPVRSSYWGFMDVNIQNDLEACADFLSAANYPNPMDALEAEWGSTNNVRWLLSTNGITSGVSTPDSYPIWNNIIVGQEAYGVVKLGSKEAEFIVKPLGSSGTSDPLNQRGSVGYKYPFATRLLNDNWITRLLSTQRL